MSKPRLPIVGSSAASTAFCSARIEGPDGSYLYIDGNGKVTAGNGTLREPRPNAFSLVQIETCPQSTPTCQSACYVHNLQTAQGAVWDLYRHNTDEMRAILEVDEKGRLESPDLVNEWVMIMAAWIRENAPHGFRWHVSGDVFSLAYAQWIADVCREAPEVRFWIYTRSFDYLEPLHEVATVRGGNLAINLSCDVDNYDAAVAASSRWEPDYDPLRLCYLTVDGFVPHDLDEDDVIFPDYNLRPRAFATLAESPWWQSITPFQRGLVCPVDAHNKSENRRCGPCRRCLT